MAGNRFALSRAQTESARGTASGDVPMDKGMHPHDALPAGIAAEKAPEAVAVPIVAEKVMQQRCTDHRSGFVPGQTHPAGDGISRPCHSNRMVVDRIIRAVVLEAAQLLELGVVQDIPGKLLDFTVHWTHLPDFYCTLIICRKLHKNKGKNVTIL